MATYTKRGARWRVEVRRLGVYESETFQSKGEGQVWATRLEADILARSRGMIASGHSVKEMLQTYKGKVTPSRKGARWEALRLDMLARDIPWVGRAVDRIQPDDVSEWRDGRLLVVSPSTVKRELGLLSAVFEMARREWRWTATNPVRDVRKPADGQARTRTVSPSEWRALMRAVGWFPGRLPQSSTAWAVAAFCLSARTAMRAGEILSIGAWDSKRRVVHLPKTKNGTSRDVPLSRQAVRIMAGLMFPIPLTSGHLDAMFRRARRLAGIEGLRFHDARHSATTMLARKLPVMDLARVTGHSDLRQLLRYYNPSVDSLADRLR